MQGFCSTTGPPLTFSHVDSHPAMLRTRGAEPRQVCKGRKARTCNSMAHSEHSVNASTVTVNPQHKQVLQHQVPRHHVPEHHHDEGMEAYNWEKQWYPLASVADYDRARPHAEMLLGTKLVLWNDSEGQWRCFEDECPHRLVPLSEGRIDASGNLMCGYHGWSFSGGGKIADIPQLRSKGPKAKSAVEENPKSCAKVRPVQIAQGLIFVWGESGPQAQEESSETPLSLSTYRQKAGEENIQPFFNMYIRDLPGNFEVWTENMQDQSHVAFAHHGVAGRRGGDHEGFFKAKEVHRNPTDCAEDGTAYHLDFDWTSNGKRVTNTELFFKPPCLSSFHSEGGKGSLYIYAVPLSANATRLIINAVTTSQQVAKTPLGLVAKLFPHYYRVFGHLTLNKVNQGDAVFMTGQQRALGRTSTRQSETDRYFLATDADRGIATWNSWLKKEGGGGPTFSEPAFTESLWWSNSGHLKREHVLDNWSQHTSKCTSCQKVLSDVEKAQNAAKFIGLFSFFAVAAYLGQGYLPWSAPTLTSLLIMGASGLAYTKLSAVQRRFFYEPWSQADLD